MLKQLQSYLLEQQIKNYIGVLPDWMIQHYAYRGMISPFKRECIREIDGNKVISYGLSSYGYDLRISDRDIKIFRHLPGNIVDPKAFNPNFLYTAEVIDDPINKQQYFILPQHTYCLGVTVEYLNIPRDITVNFWNKSTYARCGISANLTPGEAGWKGYLTVEISNLSDSDVIIYLNEGLIQAQFFKGAHCSTSYADRKGKYQGQDQQITLAKV